MPTKRTKKVSKNLGVRATAGETFAEAVQKRASDTKDALNILTSIRLTEKERDRILNPAAHEKFAGSAQ